MIALRFEVFAGGFADAGAWAVTALSCVDDGSSLSAMAAQPTADRDAGGDAGSRLPRVDELAALRQVRVGARGEVETAGTSLPALHLRDRHPDPSFARLGI